ncbi:MAG TPA: CPBP family intramembrane glutamic endopeptidase [Gemmatimonadales bacterium]|nr:CPBP family intramembrane glutamic endopeptidase [Gemmatimonadales bacterium]
MARVSFEDVKRVAIGLGWIALFAVVGLTITVGLSALLPGWGGNLWFLFRNGLYEVIGFLAATIVVGQLLNKYSWDRMGWHTEPGGLLPRLMRGIGLGAVMAALAIGLAFVFDHATVRVAGNWSIWPRVALPLLFGLLLAALGEELIFRGYPLRRLADAIGAPAAMFVLALLFGLAHAGNPNATFLSTVNVALAAIWLSIAFFSAGGMALAWGLHFGWNAGLAILFDAPVSGYTFDVPVVDYIPGRHRWVDGGAFGPEGGIVSTIVLIAGTLAVLGTRVKQPRTWLAG